MDLSTALAFVGAQHRGVLTTIKVDGRPQLSNITYHLGDDGIVRISVTDSRAKTRNLRRDPRASLHVTSDDFWQYVVIDGQADLAPPAAATDDATVDELVAYYRAVAGEHPDWDDYRRAMVEEGRLIVRLRPERAYGMLRAS
jgi:PPOX class probable F420-dependent enzyme